MEPILQLLLKFKIFHDLGILLLLLLSKRYSLLHKQSSCTEIIHFNYLKYSQWSIKERSSQ